MELDVLNERLFLFMLRAYSTSRHTCRVRWNRLKHFTKDFFCDIITDMISKKVSDSFTTQVQVLMPEHINGQSRMFGGKIMEWIDVVAAVVARRHSGCEVTTACVDTLEFKAPAYVNSTLIIEGRMTWVGNTSMEVRVDAFTESLSGERKQITKAYLVLVAIDEAGSPVIVPRLEINSAEEKTEFENGVIRAEMRAERRKM